MARNNIPKTHLFSDEDLHLYEIQNIFTACALWLEEGMENQIATYDVVVRDMPPHRNFLLLGGIEEIITGIKKWKYSKDEVAYLHKHKLATPKLITYLRNFKFTGDVWAMPEGTVFFPGEPIVRISAPICEGNLFSNFLMTTVFGNTGYLSKMIRGKIAAGSKRFVAAGGMRISSFEAGMKASRAGYIAGANGAFPAFYRKYGITPPALSLNSYHAVIKSFPTELDAFRAANKLFPNRTRPMVDTYDFEQGIQNIITVSRELREKGESIAAINIDSGDLHKRAVYARRELDKAGFPDIKILLASNLDEYKITKLERTNTPADTYLCATEVSTISDAPKIEVVYKMSELRHGHRIRPLAKLTQGKESYPGRKQVFRAFDSRGKMAGDIIGIEQERLGTPLLVPMIRKGKLVYDLPLLDDIRGYVEGQVSQLPKRYLSIEKEYTYPVKVSAKMKKLFASVKKEHTNILKP